MADEDEDVKEDRPQVARPPELQPQAVEQVPKGLALCLSYEASKQSPKAPELLTLALVSVASALLGGLLVALKPR